MKLFFTCLSSFLLFSIHAQNVSLDPTFGNAGVVITPNTSEINATAIAADGSIFNAGYTMQAGISGIYHLCVSKHTSDGSPASGFGTNGLVNTSVNYSEMPYDIVLQADGKILVAGSAYLGPTPSGPGDYRSFVIRYLSDGTPDPSFATNGIFQLSYSNSHFTSILMQNNGSMLLVGNAGNQACIVKLTSNGTPDNGYGSGGVKFIGDVSYFLIAWGGISLCDGATLVYGYEASDWENTKVTCAKLDAQGNFVTAFGQGGKAIFDTFDSDSVIDPVVEFAYKAIELPDGKIILNGQSMNKLILKLQPNGTLDSGFAVNGILNHSFPSTDIQVQTDGKILLGGSDLISDYNYGLTITRLNSNGSLDLSFDGIGHFTTDISPENDYFQTLELISPDKLIVGGSSRYSNFEANFMLVKIDISQSLGISATKPEQFSVFPNPFTNKLSFSTNGLELSRITLVDAAGRIVNHFASFENNTLYFDGLSSGMYQLVITTTSGENKQINVIRE